jgi:hypothetical protein
MSLRRRMGMRGPAGCGMMRLDYMVRALDLNQ